MKAVLLDTPSDNPSSTDMKSSSRFEAIFSFRCLVTGAICVWQECWNVLQACKRKTAGRQAYIDQTAETLDKLKTYLIRCVEHCQYKQLVKCIASLEYTYLYLQAMRLSTFMRIQRLLDLLNTICTEARSINFWCTSFGQVEFINKQLVSNFRLHQRDNIEDFLVHLESYFQPKMKEMLEEKTWLICHQGITLHYITVI